MSWYMCTYLYMHVMVRICMQMHVGDAEHMWSHCMPVPLGLFIQPVQLLIRP